MYSVPTSLTHLGCITGFLETYDEVRTQELERHRQTQASIVALLEHSSRVSENRRNSMMPQTLTLARVFVAKDVAR